MPRPQRAKRNTISEITRRDAFDYIVAEKIDWSGRLEEPAFLERIWDLLSTIVRIPHLRSRKFPTLVEARA